MECASLTLAGALHPDASTVGVDDELAEREAEPRTPRPWHVRTFRSLELSENHLMVLLGNTRSIVRDREQDRIRAVAPGIEMQRHRRRRMGQRILDEVAEHALEQMLIDLDDGCVVGDIDRR